MVFLNREETPQFANDLTFVWLTNNTFMKKQADVIVIGSLEKYYLDAIINIEEMKYSLQYGGCYD